MIEEKCTMTTGNDNMSHQVSGFEAELATLPLHVTGTSTELPNVFLEKSQNRIKHGIICLVLSIFLPRCDAIVANGKTSSAQTNALALLNTARLLREQKLSFSAGNFDRPLQTQQTNRRKRQSPEAFLRKSIQVNNSSWKKLFDDDIDRERQDALISSRVQAHLPSIKSLRTSLGSEIPDMELYLQMEAAKARAIANGHGNADNAAALAFIDLLHEKVETKSSVGGNRASISAVEKVAMRSLPSQLPGLATSVLSKHRLDMKTSSRIVPGKPNDTHTMKSDGKLGITQLEKHTPNHTVKQVARSAKATNSNLHSSQPMASLANGKNDGRNMIKKIKSKHVSTIMSTRKALQLASKDEVKEQSEQNQSLNTNLRVSHDEEIQLARIIQKGVELHNVKAKFEDKYGRDITRQEWTKRANLSGTKELRRMVSDYRQAKSKLVMANMGLVHAVVRTRLQVTGSSTKITKTDRNGVSYEEMVQEGSLGLLRAAELFDPSRGLRFSTYATIWIKGVLGNSNMSETIKLPLREKTKLNKIQTAIADLELENGGSDHSYQPTETEISERSGMSTEEVKTVMSKMKRAKNVLSLDYQYETNTRSGNINNSYAGLQNDKNLMDDVDLVERLHVRADIIAALARNLDPREARLMRLRYGLNDGCTRSIKDCAAAMGISQSLAKQLAAGCLKKLREADDAESLQEYLLSVA